MNADDHSFREKPLCPNCRKPMRFARAIPGIGGLPELLTFECRICAISVTDTRAELTERKIAS
jgi:hypothetical protein